MVHLKTGKIKLWYLKNSMIIGYVIANSIGILAIDIVSQRSLTSSDVVFTRLKQTIDFFYQPIGFLAVLIFAVIYERPVRKVLIRKFCTQQPVPDALILKARQRLLNEPFLLVALAFLSWCVAAIIYPLTFYLNGIDFHVILRSFFQTGMAGIITAICAFFILERRLQKQLVPILFPKGGLYATPKTLRISIGIRLAALILAANIMPCISVLIILSISYTIDRSPQFLLDSLRLTFFTNSLIFIFEGVIVISLVAQNLIQPFEEIISALRNIRKGDLNQWVRVTTNDEIGYTGDVINEMTQGLKERERMRQSLEVAKRIQQNLLPKFFPSLPTLDIAGKSIYCDQTGGDYFDFLEFNDPDSKMLGILVGDVSGHGISSALLMTTARAFLRLRSFMQGSIAQVVMDVNRQLSRDVADSGQFMTLFYMVIDPQKNALHWVRAGHDPAIFYDAKTDRFEMLSGKGIALGVDESVSYEENIKHDLTSGQIILIGTDGIWEARSPKGKMFGKTPLYEIIRKNADAAASDILNAIIEALDDFQHGRNAEDDITLIVIKIRDDHAVNAA